MESVIWCFKMKSDKMEHSEFLYFTEMGSREGILGFWVFSHILQRDFSMPLTEVTVYFPRSGVGASQLALQHPDCSQITKQINRKESVLTLLLITEYCRWFACFQGIKSHLLFSCALRLFPTSPGKH